MQERTLVWDGCLNVRDLGGYPTEDGAVTRFGAVVRADSVRRLTDAGWASLVAYGIGTIVDLRFHDELATDPPAELPVEVVHVPLLPDVGSPGLAEIDALAAAAPDGVTATALVYGEFLERFATRFVEAVAAVADAPPGGVVVHCFAGKDRTGVVSALLLRLAGVPSEYVAADYALSEERLRRAWEPWVSGAEDDEERERRRRLAATPAEAMLRVLAGLERRHGSARDYLLAAGAAEATLERVRARLRNAP